VKFVRRRYTIRSGAPTVVSGRHDHKVHSLSHLIFYSLKQLSNATVYKVHTHIDTVKRYGDKLLITITISAVIKRLPISSPIFGIFVFPFPRGIPVGIPWDCESTSLPHGGVIPADRVQITDEYAGRVIGTAPATAAALSDSWPSCTRRAAPPGERTNERDL